MLSEVYLRDRWREWRNETGGGEKNQIGMDAQSCLLILDVKKNKKHHI